MQVIKTLAAFLFFSSRAQMVDLKVQCSGDDVVVCGAEKTTPCPAISSSTFTVGDVYLMDFVHAADEAETLCAGAGDEMGCEEYTKSIFIEIVAGQLSTTGVDVELTKGGVEALCPSGCMTSDGEFSGVCQNPSGEVEGNVTGACETPSVDLTDVCVAPLKLGKASLSCVSGNCLPVVEPTSTIAPEMSTSGATQLISILAVISLVIA